MCLQDQIDLHRREIHTDSYQMSIGELINIYRDGELDIHPEYQRFFRWTSTQKSRWIESILLGIPLPSIFVAQREDGVWDLIDGLQRISTLLELTGELTRENGDLVPQLVLEGTKYLPALANKTWGADEDGNTLSADQQRFIKRSKISVNIILRESHEGTQYELFQRLNTGGTFLSDQELRSALLIGVNRNFYRFVHDLSQRSNFQACLTLSEKQIEEQYDLELAVRFIVFRKMDPARVATVRELSEFLTDEIIQMAQSETFPYQEEESAFETTFDLLASALGEDVFRKYDVERSQFSGPFSVSAFEVIALGLGSNFNSYSQDDSEEIKMVVIERVWTEPNFLTSSGQRATQRLPRTLARGRELFSR